jgi:hypothetical protein
LELAGAVLINPRRFGLQTLKLQIFLISSPMGRKSYFSESDVMPLVKRYTSSTLLTLLREIAKCETAKLDWDALVKSSATGISSAREYQALWRSLAYRVELKQCFEEDECPLVGFC